MIDKDLLALIGSDRKYIFYTVGLMLVGSVSSILTTGGICYLIWLASQSAQASAYVWPGLLICLALLGRYISTRASAYYKDCLGRKVKAKLRSQTYQKILRLGVTAGEEISLAGLTQVAIEGIEQLDLYYSTYIPQFFFALLAPIILFLVTVRLDWRVALTLLACVPLIPLSIVAVSKYAKRIFNKYWTKYTTMGDAFLDSVQGLKELKIFQADQAQQDKIMESAEEFRLVTMKVLTMQLASTTIMDLVAYGGAAAGIGLTVSSLVYRQLNPIVALFLILVAVDFFLPLRAFGSAFHIAMNGLSAGKKIISLLALDEPVWGSEEVAGLDLKIRDLNFAYPDQDQLIRDLNLDFPACGLRAIVGQSGCGKSTVVKLLSGAVRPQSGQVSLGGINLDHLQRESYYSKLAIVSYNTYIFNQTIRQNFLLAKPEANSEEIYAVLEKVNLASFVRQLGGLDRLIQEDASNLSGGQKQRLALAINLLADKSIYIFDEATSNIDLESEAIIMENIQQLAKSKSVILISHRLANVVDADLIYFLADGRLIESGDHQALCQLQGQYAKLYQAQTNLEKAYRREVLA